MRPRLANRILWIGCCCAAVLGAVFAFLNQYTPAVWITGILAPMDQVLYVAAYSFALYFWLKILADHAPDSTMRLAWIMMSWSSAFSILRHGFEFTAYVAGWTRMRPNTLVGLRQIPMVLSLLLLTAGLIAMWSSFAAIGIGLRFRQTDLLWVAGIIAVVPVILSSRENMQDARSTYALIRRLQSVDPILLAVPALLSVALHRIRQEMGGGQLATSLRLLVAFLVLRLVAMLAGTSRLYGDFPVLSVIALTLGWAAPWLFPLSALQRWNLTVSAREMEQRYESNPSQEVASLSSALPQLADSSE
jgi:hypothetical protein